MIWNIHRKMINTARGVVHVRVEPVICQVSVSSFKPVLHALNSRDVRKRYVESTDADGRVMLEVAADHRTA